MPDFVLFHAVGVKVWNTHKLFIDILFLSGKMFLQTNFDDELEKVKLEILQQRAVALREQEDRLGGMVAQLQLNKAKEVRGSKNYSL